MSKRSPFSIRPGRPIPGHRGIAVSGATKELLDGDYPQEVKMRALLASKGALSGRRECVLCQGRGHIIRVHVPPRALSVDQPDYRGIAAYWLCGAHAELTGEDPAVQAALARRKR